MDNVSVVCPFDTASLPELAAAAILTACKVNKETQVISDAVIKWMKLTASARSRETAVVVHLHPENSLYSEAWRSRNFRMGTDTQDHE